RFLTANVFAPLAALIINARRGAKGQPGLRGPAMEEAINAFVASRLRSIAFLKSGWIGAIKKMIPYADRRGGPRQDRTAKEYGQAKGDAKPSVNSGFKARATIEN